MTRGVAPARHLALDGKTYMSGGTAEKVAVIGAGVMGTGLAQCCVAWNLAVDLYDVSEESLLLAKTRIGYDYKAYYMTHRGALPGMPGPGVALSRIDYRTDLEQIRDASYVIENITENWDAKRVLYSRLDRLCAPDCIVAVNTSAIPISRFAGLLRNPERVIGIHFMNPVAQKKVVELICTPRTSEATLARTQALLQSIGKQWIAVKDGAGFVSNRILMITINESIQTLEAGRAGIEAIDAIFRECFSHKMGPLETADLIGLDTILNTLIVLYDEYKEDKYRPAPLLVDMVGKGKLGRKSKRGFYSYGL